MKKTIVFDVDGVITDSGSQKDKIIEEILDRNNLLDIPGVKNILDKGLNRIVLLEEIFLLQEFDREKVLSEINNSLITLESSIKFIFDTSSFIKENLEKYNFFTNTSMPKAKLQRIFGDLDFGKYFLELLAYDDGSKKENIEYIMQVHDVKAKDILFIDDKQCHIDAVKNTGVHTLLFEQDGVSLEEKINSIFG